MEIELMGNEISENISIIGGFDSGKTTILKKLFYKYRKLGYRIIIVDSATEHMDKSIIKYISKNFIDIQLIESPGRDSIFDLELIEAVKIMDIYPFNLVKKGLEDIVCIDVAKYLEKGYETDDYLLRSMSRMVYKKFVVQSLRVIYEFLGNRKTVVLMDEVELIDDMKKIIYIYNSKNVYFICALHEKESLCNSIDLFKFYHI